MEASSTGIDKDRRLPPLAFDGEALVRLAPDGADFKDGAVTRAPEQLPHPASGSKQALSAQGWKIYLPVQAKFVISLLFFLLWAAFSAYLSQPWTRDLAAYIGYPPALTVIAGIAIVPGFMNAFMVRALLLDWRPAHAPLPGCRHRRALPAS